MMLLVTCIYYKRFLKLTIRITMLLYCHLLLLYLVVSDLIVFSIPSKTTIANPLKFWSPIKLHHFFEFVIHILGLINIYMISSTVRNRVITTTFVFRNFSLRYKFAKKIWSLKSINWKRQFMLVNYVSGLFSFHME